MWCEDLLPRYGIESTLVDGLDLDQWRKAMRPNTKSCFLESPTNPTLDVLDIGAIAEIAHQGGARLIVDNVFATPIWQSPLVARRRRRGVFRDQAYRRPGPLPRRRHPVVGSLHRRAPPQFHAPDRPVDVAVQRLGAAEGAGDAGVRVRAQTESAAAIADVLAQHPKISRLIYPGRADHPQAAIVKKQMRGGSTLVGFEVKGGKAAASASSTR